MEYHLPSYEECKSVVNAAGELLFKETVSYVDGYKISMFTYGFAGYNDFVQYKAFEYRGLCFVFNLDGTLYKRYLKLNKFFNLNEVEINLMDNVKDKKIKEVFNKEDGSLVTYIKLPNGIVKSTTKKSVDNEQCVACNKLLFNNNNLLKFVDYCLEKDIVAVFEYVSPFNKIVLNYTDTELVLLKLRDNNTGEYISFDQIPTDILNGVKLVQKEPYNDINELFVIAETLENKEGWVITFDDNHMLKLKTQWYFRLHHLTTETMNREDYVIAMIRNETIDDAISVIEKNDLELLAFVNEVRRKFLKFINFQLDLIKQKRQELKDDFNGDVKAFVLKNKTDEWFHMYMGVLNGKDEMKAINYYLDRNTYLLSDARKFLKNIE